MARPTSTRSRKSRLRLAAILAAAAVGIVAALAGGAFASVSTDQQDYTPGSVVTISGGNDTSGLPGYAQGHTVNVAATADNGLWTDSCPATVAADGTWSCTVRLSSDPATAVGSYHYTATSTDANDNPISETGTFTDVSAPSSDVSFPVAGTYYNNAGWDAGCTSAGFCGTASKQGSSGNPTGVRVQIQRGTGGATYWNGSSWVSDNSTTVTATTSGSGTTINWSYGFGHGNFPAEDRYSVSSQAYDGLNWGSLGGGSAFYIDNTAPSSSITCNAAACSGTYSGTVTVGLSATDPTLGTTGHTGSGVYQIKYTTDGTTTPDATHGTVYAGTFSLSSTTTVKYAAIDNAGNVESAHTQTITFGSSNHPPTAPGTPALQSPTTMTPNKTGDFTVVWTASTDPDPGDTVTYELQKHDYSTSSWTSVQSGLTTNSYTFSGEGEGSWSYRVQASDNHGATSSWAADSSPIVVVDKTAPNTPTAAATTSSVYTDASSHNWWKDTVTVSFTANGDPALSDGSAGSGVDSSTLTGNLTYTTQGLHTASGTVKDYATNESTAGTLAVYVDNAVPTFGACPVAGPFLLGSGDHSVGPISASDTGGSGVDSSTSTLSGTVHTDAIGTKTLTFTAYDNVGHSATTTCNYDVIYNFTGFFQPVDNPDTCNKAKAGSAIPVKFSLDGYQGMAIIATGYPKANPGSCNSNAIDQVEETMTAGQSSLNYDATADQYIYVWKTDKAWAGKAILLDVLLVDGTHHYARFSFTK